MFSYLEERTPAEVEAIRRTIQELLRQTCILQVKYDPVTLTARDNGRYQVCLKHREFIADYLSVMGCEPAGSSVPDHRRRCSDGKNEPDDDKAFAFVKADLPG